MTRFANRDTLTRAAGLALDKARALRREAEIAFKAGRGRDGREALDLADDLVAEAEAEAARYAPPEAIPEPLGRC